MANYLSSILRIFAHKDSLVNIEEMKNVECCNFHATSRVV